jgi:hypothetical protein
MLMNGLLPADDQGEIPDEFGQPLEQDEKTSWGSSFDRITGGQRWWVRFPPEERTLGHFPALPKQQTAEIVKQKPGEEIDGRPVRLKQPSRSTFTRRCPGAQERP